MGQYREEHRHTLCNYYLGWWKEDPDNLTLVASGCPDTWIPLFELILNLPPPAHTQYTKLCPFYLNIFAYYWYNTQAKVKKSDRSYQGGG